MGSIESMIHQQQQRPTSSQSSTYGFMQHVPPHIMSQAQINNNSGLTQQDDKPAIVNSFVNSNHSQQHRQTTPNYNDYMNCQPQPSKMQIPGQHPGPPPSRQQQRYHLHKLV